MLSVWAGVHVEFNPQTASGVHLDDVPFCQVKLMLVQQISYSSRRAVDVFSRYRAYS